MNKLSSLIKDSNGVLGQLELAITQLQPSDYTHQLALIDLNTIGMHIRHVIEFYTCLIDGLASKSIDYDLRKRNAEIETNKTYALAEIERIKQALELIDADQSLAVIYQNNPNHKLKSSLSREMAFNLEHTIHHMAILKICIHQACTYIQLDPNFGLAFSTLKHREKLHVHSKLSS